LLVPAQQTAVTVLHATFKRGTKREHPSETAAKSSKRTRTRAGPEDHEKDLTANTEEVGTRDESSDVSELESPHKLSRLAKDVRKKPAVVLANQVLVDAFADFGEQQLEQGHTGKGVTHLRAAQAMRDYHSAIASGAEAQAVPHVGPKMAAQVEQILTSGELEDEAPWLNVSTADVAEQAPPRLVKEVRSAKAKRPENQPLVDELAKFGEHELYFRSGSKGTTHLRAARSLQRTNVAVTCGEQARTEVPLVGPAIADKIDQILKCGHIFRDTAASDVALRTAPIVKDLRETAAVRPENQPLVDALVDYGDSHLHSGHRGRGITHLRAARAIRDAEVVVASGKQAMESIKLVGERVAAKIDQVLEHGHADSETEAADDSKSEEGSEFGAREPPDTPPIVREVSSKPAQVEGNQEIVDVLAGHGQKHLAKCHTSQGTAFMRAARRLRDAAELVTSGSVAKTLGCIGDKVVAFIDTMVAFKSTEVATPDTADEAGK
jgi:DNA polymerase/3'-5' exonuclease PolX